MSRIYTMERGKSVANGFAAGRNWNRSRRSAARLGEIDHGFDFQGWESWELRPREQFPHCEAWNDRSLLTRSAPDKEDEDAYERWMDSEEYTKDYHAYLDGVGTSRGCIPICHRGCALRDWLVVTGPEAGHVWHDASADDGGISPIRIGTKTRVTFSDCYLDWIEQSLR